MSIATSIRLHYPGSRRSLLDALRRMPRVVWIVLAILVSWTGEFTLYRTFEPPGQALRHELEGAAAELAQPVLIEPTPVLQQAIRRHFRESAVAVDFGRQWPNVAVTLTGVSWATCTDAVREASRIDGLVAVRLANYRSAKDCHERNDMTWLLMP
jgi:hypothetical protein